MQQQCKCNPIPHDVEAWKSIHALHYLSSMSGSRDYNQKLLQAFLQWLHSWSNLVGEQGLISVDLSDGGKGQFPESSLSDLCLTWRQTFCQHPSKDLTPSVILAAAAAAGLVPRPSTGLRFSRSGACLHGSSGYFADCQHYTSAFLAAS